MIRFPESSCDFICRKRANSIAAGQTVAPLGILGRKAEVVKQTPLATNHPRRFIFFFTLKVLSDIHFVFTKSVRENGFFHD